MSHSTTANVSSYEIGKKPYNPDAARGKWSSKWDFIYASLGHAFEMRNFQIYPFFMISHGGFLAFFPYMLSLLLFSIPIFFVQSFLGQFSSSGLISALRIAPIFKGLAYGILLVNLITSSYYTVIASIPLIYTLGSLHPTIPWMTCENTFHNCTNNYEIKDNFWTFIRFLWEPVEAKVQPAQSYFSWVTNFSQNLTFSMSWQITLASLFIWILIGLIVIKGVETIGQILRYMVPTVFIFLIIIFIRLLFTEAAWNGILLFFKPKFPDLVMWMIGPMIALTTFGSGWGITLTLASYNKFHENIENYSLIINFGHMILLMISGLISSIINNSITMESSVLLYLYKKNPIGYIFIINAYFFGTLELPNFWCFIFFAIVFCCELITCILHVFTILTAIFDEFESIRIYKKQFTWFLVIFMALGSTVFSLSIGLHLAASLMSSSGVFTYFICFIELMIVLWIYGRERFYKDVEFLLSRKYLRWKFIVLRYVTPTILLYSFALLLVVIVFHIQMEEEPLLYVPNTILSISSIMMFSIYIIYTIKDGSGSNIFDKFKFLCRPIDWYPVDPDIRSQYELCVNKNTEMRQGLITSVDNNGFDSENNDNYYDNDIDDNSIVIDTKNVNGNTSTSL